jgi:hypothetical protein
MHFTRCLLAAASLAAAVPAQLTLTDGNLDAVFGALSATSHLPPAFELRADALAVNHAFQHGWYFRVAGDTREFSLRDIGGVSGGLVGTDHADRDFADLDARGLLKASIDYDAYDAGPASGVVISRMTLTNRSNAPVAVDVFCYTDLDVASTSADDVCTLSANPGSHFVTDANGVLVEVRALDPDISQVDAYPTIRTALSNTALDDLTQTVAPFTGDYTGAFQWQARTLAPFEQRTFTVAYAVNTPANALPLVEHYGAGNGSTFEIHTQTLPLQDNSQLRTIACQMKGALPNVEQRTILGLDPWTPQPYIPGLDLWVLPPSIIGVYGFMTSATGTAQEVFFIPPGPYFTGINVYFQVFSVDAAAPNGFAYFSPGMRLRIGRL